MPLSSSGNLLSVCDYLRYIFIIAFKNFLTETNLVFGIEVIIVVDKDTSISWYRH